MRTADLAEVHLAALCAANLVKVHLAALRAADVVKDHLAELLAADLVNVHLGRFAPTPATSHFAKKKSLQGSFFLLKSDKI